MTTLGQRVQQRRTQLGLRPEHLAAAANMSVATIYNLEKDKHMIRADRIVPLAKALKVSLEELLGVAEGTRECASEPPAVQDERDNP